MPRMPKYLKEEWAFFLDERGRKEIQRALQEMRKELQAELPCRRYPMPTLSIENENKTMTDYPNNTPAKLEIIKASKIILKEVRWLWYPYIPFGKVTLLQGDPGDGKSKLMLSLAALLSKGAPLPFADEDEGMNLYGALKAIYEKE